MFCKKCGSQIAETMKFCNKCGAPTSFTSANATREDKEKINPAGFWVRAGAFLIDYAIAGLGGGLLIGIIIYILYPESTFLDNLSEYEDGILTLLIAVIYHSIALTWKSTTIGKKLFGLKVINQSNKKDVGIGRALARSFSYFLSSLFFCIGFIMVATDREKHQGLHDKIAKTLVVKEKEKKHIIGIAVAIVSILALIYVSSDWFIVENTVDDIKPSVANVYCPFASEGMYLESDGYGGSGTVMTSEGMILTNSHVIPQTDDYITTPDEGCFVILYNLETGEDDIYLAKPIVIPEISEEYDLAYLSIYDVYVDEEGAWGEYPKSFTPFDDSLACDSSYINLGDEIRIYGYPISSGGLSLTVTDGIVSSLPGDGTLLTSAKIDSGNSGGIAVDYNGCMIGVPVAVSEGEYENMGVIISIDLVYEFEDKLALYTEGDRPGKTINGASEVEVDLIFDTDINLDKIDIGNNPKFLFDQNFSPENVSLFGIEFSDTINDIPAEKVDSVVESAGWVHLNNGASYRLSEGGTIVEFALHDLIISELGILRRDEMEFKFGEPDKIEEDTGFDATSYDYYYYDKGIIVRWWGDEISLINIIEK